MESTQVTKFTNWVNPSNNQIRVYASNFTGQSQFKIYFCEDKNDDLFGFRMVVEGYGSPQSKQFAIDQVDRSINCEDLSWSKILEMAK
jgi:hypothetical protein